MEKVWYILADIIDKIKEIIINILRAVPGETLVTLILAGIIVIYFLKASKDKVERTVQSKKNKTKQRLCMEELELELQMFFGLMSGGNKPAFLKACQSYMDKHNYKLSRKTAKQMVYDTMWVKNNNAKQKTKYLDDPKADQLIDAIYKFMQIGFEKGPEYEKFQKKLKSKIKDIKIDVNAPEFEDIKKRVVESTSDNMQMQNQMSNDMNMQIMDDMNRHMQEHMINDMQMQMQQQMMNDMQMQMQVQMMNDMQMQMQMQMMNDMQMQMQQQMMNDMQMQMQNQMMNDMNQQMLNSMNDANMAITSTDFGGHMNSDMNSGNFGMF